MSLREIINLLNSNKFIMIKVSNNYEIWEKNGKLLTIPTNSDTLNISLAKNLIKTIKES